MKDLDDPRKETAEQRAIRMWGNYDLTRRFLAELQRKEAVQRPVKTAPDIAEVIESERPRAEAVTRFERKFIKDFKAMLEDHKRRNVALYRVALLTRIQRLKAEMARRLEAREQPKKRDLFSWSTQPEKFGRRILRPIRPSNTPRLRHVMRWCAIRRNLVETYAKNGKLCYSKAGNFWRRKTKANSIS